jgi:hypothetical protein
MLILTRDDDVSRVLFVRRMFRTEPLGDDAIDALLSAYIVDGPPCVDPFAVETALWHRATDEQLARIFELPLPVTDRAALASRFAHHAVGFVQRATALTLDPRADVSLAAAIVAADATFPGRYGGLPDIHFGALDIPERFAAVLVRATDTPRALRVLAQMRRVAWPADAAERLVGELEATADREHAFLLAMALATQENIERSSEASDSGGAGEGVGAPGRVA